MDEQPAPGATIEAGRASPAKTPLAMVIGAFLAGVWAALTAMVLPLAAAGALPLSIGGAPVPSKDWMRIAAPLVIAAAALMAAFAAGVAARRAWTRPLMPLLGAAFVLDAGLLGLSGAIPPNVAVRIAVEGAVITAVTGWYFYRKLRVVAYYRSLRRR
jgi:hypothetical protein